MTTAAAGMLPNCELGVESMDWLASIVGYAVIVLGALAALAAIAVLACDIVYRKPKASWIFMHTLAYIARNQEPLDEFREMHDSLKRRYHELENEKRFFADKLYENLDELKQLRKQLEGTR